MTWRDDKRKRDAAADRWLQGSVQYRKPFEPTKADLQEQLRQAVLNTASAQEDA